MIAATRRWVRRNRNNLLIGAGVIGAGYLAGQYVLSKLYEARQRMSEDRMAKENLRRRFQQNQEDCRYTVIALLPTIRDEIIGALPVEQITEQLQHERQERLKRLGQSEAASSELPSGPPSINDDASSLQSGSYVHASQMAGSSTEGGASQLRTKKSKAQLWQDMKINSVTRALALLYTVSLLTILTRIQLNLLGRRTYLSSVVALATPPAATEPSTISLENKDDDNYDNVYGSDFETNRKYLTFSWWLLHRGSKQITERVMAAVKDVFGGINIREDITLERLGDLIMQVRKKVEGATEEDRRQMKWLDFLLPPKEDESFVIRQAGLSESEDSPSPEARYVDDPMTASAMDAEAITASLRRLLDETSDLIDSPTFGHVLTRLLDSSFSHLVDYRIATEAYKADISAPLREEPRVQEVSENKCKVAHILPVFCKQAHAIAAGSGDLEDLTEGALPQALRNEYLDAIEQVHDLEAFAAVIYSSNFEYEVVDDSPMQATPPPSSSQPVVADDSKLPGSTAQVHETEPQAAVDSILGTNEAPLPSAAVGESAHSGAEQRGPSGFEAAWAKATTDHGAGHDTRGQF